jgi:preprotein translocase subunit SecD
VSLQRLRAYLIGSVLVVVLAVAATVASGNSPVLGLDLQGGISVTLAPVGSFRASSLDVAVDIIRNRVDGLGVAEPEISRQGDNIVVDLPGVKDRDKARRVVGRTAELRFRQVLAELPPEGETTSTTTSTTVAGAPATTAPPTTTTTAPPDKQAALDTVASCDLGAISALAEVPTTPRERDRKSACVVLPTRDEDTDDDQPPDRLLLGPVAPPEGSQLAAGLTGSGVDEAKSRFSQGQGYEVSMTLTDEGAQKFDALAAASFGQPPPTDRVAIVLDGVVQSSPAFQTSSFGGQVSITGNFTPEEAEDLATIINYGALPVQLEEQTVANVSPTLGQDQLEAGIIAGVIGLALVAIYMLFYYRLLGLVVVLGVLLSAGALYSIVSFLGETIGLTLTLAGVTGIIVSVGVTVDSYVVYFERLKDEVRTGKTVRSSVDRGFARSFRTIVAADLVSLIGAGALYFLAVGSVRGFAFYLGLSTLLDLLVAFFFMHPLVSLMARRPKLVQMRTVGIAAGLDAPGVTA